MTQKEKDNAIMNCGDNYDDILNIQYGEVGTDSRNEFDGAVEAFILAERLKAERIKVGLTQTQLAEKIGVGRSTIANLERGNSHVSLETLLRAFHGLGHRLSFAVL